MWTVNFQMFKLDLEKAEEPQIKLPTSVRSSQSKRVPEKQLLYWLYQSLWLCGSQQTVENSSRDGNTRPLYMPLRNLYAGQETTIRNGHGHQSRFYAWYWMLGAGALGRPRGMVWGGRKEEGSGWGMHVYLWRIHVDIWQNQYNIVKLKIKLN